MPESEHAELDEVLARQLRGVAAHSGTLESKSVAAMLLRAGSRKLIPEVNEVLDQASFGKENSCEARADLLGTFFGSLQIGGQSVSIRNCSRQRIDAVPNCCERYTIIVIPTTSSQEHSRH